MVPCHLFVILTAKALSCQQKSMLGEERFAPRGEKGVGHHQ